MSKKQKSVLLALTDTHHGFYVGAARYARDQAGIVVPDEVAVLGVNDVAVGVNRRVLEKAFRCELSRGVSVTDIAVKTGYTRPNHLFRTCRGYFGMSPRQYREQARLAATEQQAGTVRNLD